MDTQAVIVSSTYPTKEDAIKTGEHAVKLELAACAQISSPITSIYRWEGNICREQEYILTMKTTREKETELFSLIKKSHPYKVAEIISHPISSISPEYLSWIRESTQS